MGIPEALLKNLAMAAGGAAVAGAAGAVGYVEGRKKQEKADAKLIDFAHKEGIKKGVKLGAEKASKVFIYPVLAQCAMAYLMARVDGSISKGEKKLLDSKVDGFLSNPDLPKAMVKEIKSIQANKNLSFDDVKNYLNKIDYESLIYINNSIYDIAQASDGITESEQQLIDQFEDYILQRNDEKHDDIKDNEESIDDYLNNFVPQYKIDEANEQFSLKRKALDQAFKLKTRLNEKEIALVLAATMLQCMRIYIVNKLTEKEPANKGKKESFLHEKQEEILGKFRKDESEKSKRYYASMEQILTTEGVPFDTTKSDKYKIFKGEPGHKGANHRFSTLGHDPIIGLVIGTTNIMTNTVTTVGDELALPVTYHVRYSAGYKNPVIHDKASLVKAFDSCTKRTKKDMAPLCAAVIKQLIHISTDTYTPAGIQLPGANLLLSRADAELLTKYISTGDIVKFGASATVTEVINAIIGIIHGCFLLESGSSLDNKLNQIKTKKIIDYSMAISTGSSTVMSVITNKYDSLDWAGLIILIRKSFSDINFVYDVKQDFLMQGLKNL